jgi:hypothetical protein
VVWFAAASTITTVLHEFTHAMVAYALGVRSTLFSYFADLDLPSTQGAIPQGAVIGIAGPLFCLALGVVSWFAFRRVRNSDAGLPLLYFTVFGVGTFAGNLMSISLVGDFSRAAGALGFPMGVRFALTAIGALLLAAIHFWGGRELIRWAPAGAGRVGGTVGIIALPVIIGTAIVIVANQPMPAAFVAARVGEASFWLFAAAGALATRRPAHRAQLRIRMVDGVAFLLAVLVVRLLVPGVPLTP